MVICLVGRGWDSRRAEEVAVELLGKVPRVALGRNGVIWADGRGLDGAGVARSIHGRLLGSGDLVGCGVATRAIAAYAAAVDGSVEEGVVVEVPAGTDRLYLSDCSIGVLGLEDRFQALLEGVGIETCGELAAVPRESVEVRFGAAMVDAWRLSRAEDERRLFRAPTVDRPQATLDFIDYVVTNPEQLTFIANRLLGGVCETLQACGSHARRIELVLPLANGETKRKVLRPSRPTASRTVWLRLVRRILERLTVPDAVSGIEIQVLETEAASSIQGDLFDVGFATAAAVESALARLLELQGSVVVRPETTLHTLPEERTVFELLDTEAVTEWSALPTHVGDGTGRVPGEEGDVGLTLQLLREPKPIEVETVERRDHHVPVRYRDGEWKRFLTISGPERLSGGQWTESYAREYFRGITDDGRLIWIYREARSDSWFMQGWWD